MSDTRHTRLPWMEVAQGDGSAMIVHEHETGNQMKPKGFRIVAQAFARKNSLAEDEANAAFIVRACNNFDALLEACKEALPILGREFPFCGSKAYKQVSAAIAAAEREEASDAT